MLRAMQAGRPMLQVVKLDLHAWCSGSCCVPLRQRLLLRRMLRVGAVGGDAERAVPRRCLSLLLQLAPLVHCRDALLKLATCQVLQQSNRLNDL